MQLENRTPFMARLMRREREDGVIEATAIVKSTFAYDDEGASFVPAKEQLPLVTDRLDTPFGIFHSELFVQKDGVDLAALGTIRREAPITSAEIFLAVGVHKASLLIFGDRRWVRHDGELVPSDPTPFTEMPLAYTHAYGGSSEFNYEQVPYCDNPLGRGYYLTEEQAEGQLLPNIVRGDAPQVSRWDEQPEVAGFGPYPQFWGVRAREGIEVGPVGEDGEPPSMKLKARLSNNANSALILTELTAGEELRLSGLAERELVLIVPEVAPVLTAKVGEQSLEAEGRLDGVFWWVDQRLVTMTHRIHFTYRYQKGEPRVAFLDDRAASV